MAYQLMAPHFGQLVAAPGPLTESWDALLGGLPLRGKMHVSVSEVQRRQVFETYPDNQYLAPVKHDFW